MATKEQVFEWIYEPCALPFTDAMQIAEVVATKLAEENGSSHNTGSPKLPTKIKAISHIESGRFGNLSEREADIVAEAVTFIGRQLRADA